MERTPTPTSFPNSNSPWTIILNNNNNNWTTIRAPVFIVGGSILFLLFTYFYNTKKRKSSAIVFHSKTGNVNIQDTISKLKRFCNFSIHENYSNTSVKNAIFITLGSDRFLEVLEDFQISDDDDDDDREWKTFISLPSSEFKKIIICIKASMNKDTNTRYQFLDCEVITLFWTLKDGIQLNSYNNNTTISGGGGDELQYFKSQNEKNYQIISSILQ